MENPYESPKEQGAEPSRVRDAASSVMCHVIAIVMFVISATGQAVIAYRQESIVGAMTAAFYACGAITNAILIRHCILSLEKEPSQ